MLDLTPGPIALQLGPLAIPWYGLGYVVGLAAAYQVLVRLARRAGEDPDVVANGMIAVAVAAVIGGRLYHVIDQWPLYQDDLLKIIVPPYSGLGVYGGIFTGLVTVILYARWKRLPLARWADIIAPALFVMQAIARWGNFFNQELYGPPTNLPWAIPIECAYRIAAYPCDAFPFETTRFHPLFLYESVSGLLGAAVLIWLGFRARSLLRPGDLALLFFIWYGVVRFGLETLREDNWIFYSIPMAQIVSLLFVVPAIALLLWRHRGTVVINDPGPSRPGATWGAPGPEGLEADATTEDRDDEFDDWDDDDGEAAERLAVDEDGESSTSGEAHEDGIAPDRDGGAGEDGQPGQPHERDDPPRPLT